MKAYIASNYQPWYDIPNKITTVVDEVQGIAVVTSDR
jgi:hypothetical protein